MSTEAHAEAERRCHREYSRHVFECGAEWQASRPVTDDMLSDLHARYHDMPGNLYGRDECEWERCEFWDAAQFALEAARTARQEATDAEH